MFARAGGDEEALDGDETVSWLAGEMGAARDFFVARGERDRERGVGGMMFFFLRSI